MTSASNFMHPDGKPTPAMQPRAYLYFVIGATCAGKGTLLDAMAKLGGDKVKLVQVGKVLRQRYHPDHFKGSAAPEHTQVEAWQIVEDGIKDNDKCRAIFIDGQPRDKKQLSTVVADYFIEGPYTASFIHVWENKNTREERAVKRFEGDPASLKLALDRMHSSTQDSIKLYEILSEILISDLPIKHIHSHSQVDYKTIYEQLVGTFL